MNIIRVGVLLGVEGLGIRFEANLEGDLRNRPHVQCYQQPLANPCGGVGRGHEGLERESNPWREGLEHD